MDYQKLYRYLLEVFDDLYRKLDDDFMKLDRQMKKAYEEGQGEEIKAFKDLTLCLGKMKMLRDVRCFMLEAELDMMKGGKT